jgi:hypothetical protein
LPKLSAHYSESPLLRFLDPLQRLPAASRCCSPEGHLDEPCPASTLAISPIPRFPKPREFQARLVPAVFRCRKPTGAVRRGATGKCFPHAKAKVPLQDPQLTRICGLRVGASRSSSAKGAIVSRDRLTWPKRQTASIAFVVRRESCAVGPSHRGVPLPAATDSAAWPSECGGLLRIFASIGGAPGVQMFPSQV